MRPLRLLAVLFLVLAAPWAPTGADGVAAGSGAAPDAAAAADLLGLTGPVTVRRIDTPVPAWSVHRGGTLAGYVASTWEVAGSTGYSGQPIDMLVAVSADARIAGARLVRHAEPILTLGLSDRDIAGFVGRFAGLDLKIAPGTGRAPPDAISRATVTSGVMRDAILRTARTVAAGFGLTGGGTIDRVAFRPAGWHDLTGAGALAGTTVSLAEARAALPGATPPLPAGEGTFIEIWAGLLDPPTIGRNLLGQHVYSRIAAAQAPGDAALFVASRGLHSHRGTAWRRGGVFDRIAVVQDGNVLALTADGYVRIDRLAPADAPDFRERSVFRLPAGAIDPTRPFRVVVTAARGTAGDDVAMEIGLDYRLPAGFVTAPVAAADEPLWVSAWRRKRVEIAGVIAMLTVLAGILFFQQAFVRRPAVWRWGRIGFLSVTLVWLGWIAGGQLSVVQVMAFLHSLLSGFHWETFLIEPVIFLLWSFVALGLLFWGRGVYCGWLCPFGALQELTNEIARRLGIPQITVPFGLHERLWALKYAIFLALLALSFYSMDQALVAAEVEPFKTAISLRFLRAWPFVLFVVALLVAGLFIERFFCRYLCPLGAGLAIPAKLKLFDWLRRRPQCGRECRLCEQKCTVGAIDPLGRINPNECVLCLRCQTILHDPATCTVLKRRLARAAPPGAGA